MSKERFPRNVRVKYRTRIRCTQASEARSCPDGRAYYLEDVEAAVVNGLREQLGRPEAVALYVKAYNDERLRLAATSSTSAPRLRSGWR